jgi:hypothetical protein
MRRNSPTVARCSRPGGPALLKQRAVAAGQYFRLTDEAPGARVLSTTTLRRGFPRRLGRHPTSLIVLTVTSGIDRAG